MVSLINSLGYSLSTPFPHTHTLPYTVSSIFLASLCSLPHVGSGGLFETSNKCFFKELGEQQGAVEKQWLLFSDLKHSQLTPLFKEHIKFSSGLAMYQSLWELQAFLCVSFTTLVYFYFNLEFHFYF